MISKSLFFNLMKEDAKRRLWTMALAFLAFFFSFPVRNALVIAEGLKQSEVDYPQIMIDLNEWLSFQNGWIAVLLIFLSLIMGVTSFSYLHSRQKVDFYHGIPVNRNNLFWAYYINGILIPGVLYGANLIINLGVFAVNGIEPAKLLGTTLSGFLLFMLHYIMLYTVTVLAMVLTGNILVGILGTGVFHFYFLCAIIVLELCFNQFFLTSYRSGDELFSFLMDKCSVFALFMVNMDQMGSSVIPAWMKVTRILSALGVTVVLSFLSFWLYKKRGSEAAGKAMAFPVSMPIIRIPIVILSSLSGGIFFWALHSSIGWGIFGLLCGMLLSHCIIEIIYHFDFRKLFSHWKQMLVSAVVAAVMFCVFRYDLLGYDRYIPAENSIESVAVSISDSVDWVSYGYSERDYMGDYNWKYQDSDDYVFDHMELKNTAPVLALVRDAVKRNQELHHESELSDDYLEDGYRNFYFSVKYNLKSGKSVYRSYTLPINVVRSEMAEIYENPDYLNGIYPILTQTPEDTAWVRVSRGDQTNIVSRDRNGTDKAMTEKLLLAYQEDLKNLKAKTMLEENPTANIQFMTKNQAEAETKREELQSSWKYSDVTSRGYYPIYPSFKNTLELLKECQVDVDKWNSQGNVKEISIDIDQFIDHEYYYDKEIPYLTVTDQTQITQMMNQAVIEDYSNMNPLGYKFGERVSFTAITSGGGNEGETSYSIPVDQLPESLKAEIEKIKKDA